MAYVITALCAQSKDASCVEVCPVDCIHPMPGDPRFDEVEQLYIDPTECIDCEACLSTCPVEAIYPGDLLPDVHADAPAINASFFAS